MPKLEQKLLCIWNPQSDAKSEVLLQMLILCNHMFIHHNVFRNTATCHTQFLPATHFNQICESIIVFPSRVLNICLSYSWFELHSIAVETKQTAPLIPEPTTSAPSRDISVHFPRWHPCSSTSVSVSQTQSSKWSLFWKFYLQNSKCMYCFTSTFHKPARRKLCSSTALYNLYKPKSFLLRSKLT